MHHIQSGKGLDVSFLCLTTNMDSETGLGSLSWNPLHRMFSLALPSLHLPHLEVDEN